ncbi:hypothetical protein BH18ACT4_BH18ACT4_12490 [soil metagenome]
MALAFVGLGGGDARSAQPGDPLLPIAPFYQRSEPRNVQPPAPVAPQHRGFEAADAAGPAVPLFSAPGGSPYTSLANPTAEGYALVFAVREHRPDGWLRVSVPMRPNGTQAWIRASDVHLRAVGNYIVVEVGSRTLRVFEGGTDREIFTAPVAVGKDATPTPLGEFYVDADIDLAGGGVYGSRILSVAGFSNVHETFGGGIGHIAIHGTNNDGLIGQRVSNGCIRMHDADVDWLSVLAPPGTPVSIRG